ncbi:MAG: DUF5343 domain-containing protein [Pseudolysinimonas sp.]
MATIPIALNGGGIPRFLKHIQDAGVPSKVTVAYLKSAGFKSSNDVSLLNLFKGLGFLDASGIPTGTWKSYRDKTQAKAVLAEAIRACYPDLFHLYPDASSRSDTEVVNWIKANSSYSELQASRALKTFRYLAAEADFSGTVTASASSPAATAAPAPAPAPALPLVRNMPSVNINIELHLPATDDEKVFESLFKAMKKNLLDV